MENSKVLEIAKEVVANITMIDSLYSLAEYGVYEIEDIMCIEGISRVLEGRGKFQLIEDEKEVYEVFVQTGERVCVYKPLENDNWYCEF